jgi:hypothetical protein
MNAHSSTLHTVGEQRLLPNARGAAAERHQSGDASFASHLDADHVPPAQAARAALEDRPDLAERPFGAIVSLLARHEELPAAATDPAPEPVEETNGEVPAETEAGGETAETSGESAETSGETVATSGESTETGGEPAEAEPE